MIGVFSFACAEGLPRDALAIFILPLPPLFNADLIFFPPGAKGPLVIEKPTHPDSYPRPASGKVSFPNSSLTTPSPAGRGRWRFEQALPGAVSFHAIRSLPPFFIQMGHDSFGKTSRTSSLGELRDEEAGAFFVDRLFPTQLVGVDAPPFPGLPTNACSFSVYRREAFVEARVSKKCRLVARRFSRSSGRDLFPFFGEQRAASPAPFSNDTLSHLGHLAGIYGTPPFHGRRGVFSFASFEEEIGHPFPFPRELCERRYLGFFADSLTYGGYQELLLSIFWRCARLARFPRPLAPLHGQQPASEW